MTGLRDLLKKKDGLKRSHRGTDNSEPRKPEVMIVRSDTNTQEILNPPSFASEEGAGGGRRVSITGDQAIENSVSRTPSKSAHNLGRRGKVSSIIHFRPHSRHESSFTNILKDLPSIVTSSTSDPEEREAEWEKRATILAQGNAALGSASQFHILQSSPGHTKDSHSQSPSTRSINDDQGDVRQ